MTKKPKLMEINADDPADRKGELRSVGGSKSDRWNNLVLNQVVLAMRTNPDDEEALHRQASANLAAMVGINPKDEMEGMLAAQLLASHNAAMECFRRAMIPDQTFEGRRENLNQANKLSRTHTTLLEALNRHRGKGQQRVTVEHVTVNEGGQAIVGNVSQGGGVAPKNEDQSHAKQISHAPGTQMPREIEAERQAVPSTRRERA